MPDPKTPEYPKTISVTVVSAEHEREVLAGPPAPVVKPEDPAKPLVPVSAYPKTIQLVVQSAEHEKAANAGPQYPKKITMDVTSAAHEKAIADAVAAMPPVYVPVEYPKWVSGVLVENAAAERKVLGEPEPVAK